MGHLIVWSLLISYANRSDYMASNSTAISKPVRCLDLVPTRFKNLVVGMIVPRLSLGHYCIILTPPPKGF